MQFIPKEENQNKLTVRDIYNELYSFYMHGLSFHGMNKRDKNKHSRLSNIYAVKSTWIQYNNYIDNDIFTGSRKWFIYSWYANTFEKKNFIFNHSRRLINILFNQFLIGFTFGLIKKKYFCPYCSSSVNKLSFKNSPIYTYGCNNCRTKKSN